jgi:hypothetical protein
MKVIAWSGKLQLRDHRCSYGTLQAANQEPNWPSIGKLCPPTWIFSDGRCHTPGGLGVW